MLISNYEYYVLNLKPSVPLYVVFTNRLKHSIH